MSQASTWGVPQASPASPATYAQRDQATYNALLSAHRGPQRPAYAVAGTVWIQVVDAAKEEVYLFDGTADIYMGRLDLANHVFLPAAAGDLALRESIFEIGQWNMNTDTLRGVYHGIAQSAIRGFSAMVIKTNVTIQRFYPVGINADQNNLDAVGVGVFVYHQYASFEISTNSIFYTDDGFADTQNRGYLIIKHI